jgi:hypothetical protein
MRRPSGGAFTFGARADREVIRAFPSELNRSPQFVD